MTLREQQTAARTHDIETWERTKVSEEERSREAPTIMEKRFWGSRWGWVHGCMLPNRRKDWSRPVGGSDYSFLSEPFIKTRDSWKGESEEIRNQRREKWWRRRRYSHGWTQPSPPWHGHICQIRTSHFRSFPSSPALFLFRHLHSGSAHLSPSRPFRVLSSVFLNFFFNMTRLFSSAIFVRLAAVELTMCNGFAVFRELHGSHYQKTKEIETQIMRRRGESLLRELSFSNCSVERPFTETQLENPLP